MSDITAIVASITDKTIQTIMNLTVENTELVAKIDLLEQRNMERVLELNQVKHEVEYSANCLQQYTKIQDDMYARMTTMEAGSELFVELNKWAKKMEKISK